MHYLFNDKEMAKQNISFIKVAWLVSHFSVMKKILVAWTPASHFKYRCSPCVRLFEMLVHHCNSCQLCQQRLSIFHLSENLELNASWQLLCKRTLSLFSFYNSSEQVYWHECIFRLKCLLWPLTVIASAAQLYLHLFIHSILFLFLRLFRVSSTCIQRRGNTARVTWLTQR